MARRRVAAVDDPHDEIVAWYRHALARKPKPPRRPPPWEAVQIGPTWQRDRKGHWLLPEHTLGWDALGFCGTWLQHEPGSPWRFTLEQARFVLWWYAIDERGRFLYREGVLQRLKGWGKDPLGACLCAVEAFGPCRFAGWENDRPIATDVPTAWVQTAAVSLEQTKNTMRLFPALFSEEAKRRFRIQVGRELIHGLGDTRLIQAVTSSPATLEGNRATFVLKNETHLWTSSNEGHEMADVIERNITKAPDGAARSLGITNAYEPSEDSVAQADREAWEKAEAGLSGSVALLYDSLEAPAEAPLTLRAAPGVIRAIRGDSVWLTPERIVQSIADKRNPASRSRRWWYNQITAAEDAVFSPQEWDGAADPLREVTAGATITLGLDPSETDDHTALIGCLVDEDHLFDIGFWVPDEKTNEVDRAAIDRAVRASFELYDVVGFYSDVHPFESYVDTWAETFGDELLVRATSRQPVAWDMRRRHEEFTRAVERFHAAITASATEATKAASARRAPAPRLTHDGSRRFRVHALNARRAANKWGFTVRKEHRESAKKIDAIPAAVLARLARLDYLALPESRRRRRRRSGVIW